MLAAQLAPEPLNAPPEPALTIKGRAVSRCTPLAPVALHLSGLRLSARDWTYILSLSKGTS